MMPQDPSAQEHNAALVSRAREPIGNVLGKAELDAILARVKEEHGDDPEAFLRAVFACGDARAER